MSSNANPLSQAKRFYIASMGAITPLGENLAATAAMVNASISAYKVFPFITAEGKPVTMARVPDRIFSQFVGEIDEGSRFNMRHDRVVKMAILAIREACAQHLAEQAVPLLLAMPDIKTQDEGLPSLVKILVDSCSPWLNPAMSRSFHSGRASGMEAIAFAFEYLHGEKYPFLLLGGSDCHEDDSRIKPLAAAQRLLTVSATNAFAPGEAASFLLLTPHIELARQHKGQVVALYPPGMAEEKGHLFSDEPYRGDGLAQAFNKALGGQPEQSIHSIYSSMNGEHHWAKEYGVAFLRNRKAFKDPVRVEHPADCYGDLGSATATTLIALAAEHLFNNSKAQAHLVYSSSDAAQRGAIVLEKLNVQAQNN